MKVGQLVCWTMVVAVCGPAQAGLIYDWTFDGTEGQTANLPEAVSSNTGTTVGAGGVTTSGAAVGTGAFSRSAPNGNDDRISLTTTFDPPNAFTVAGWIKTGQASYPNIFAWTSPGVFASEVRLNGGCLQTNQYFYNGSSVEYNQSVIGNSVVNDNDWHFVAVTRQFSGGTSLFVDTAFDVVNSAAIYAGSFTGRTVYLAGHDFFSNFNYSLDGLLDDVSFWNERLDETELTALRNLGLSDLDYNAQNAGGLFNVFGGTLSHVTIGALTWRKAPDNTFAGSPGDVVDLGDGDYGLVLNAIGGGVYTLVPEPSTFALLVLACLAPLLNRRRRAGV
jgi:hypothetical protein